MSGVPNIPLPRNEPILSYAPGSPERATLKAELARLTGEVADIPAIVGGKEIRSGDTVDVTSPHKHRHIIARVHHATADTVRAAAKSAIESQREWAALRFEDRAAVFLRAAEMLATTHRALLNGSTMLGQSKTAFQAEIDSACELIDFFRFNVAYAERLYQEQPESSPGVWNRMEHRPLEGFVYAVTPFNFTAIGGNLPGAPALMGNTVVWKPSHTALLSNYYIYKLLETAGLPPGVINFVPAEAVMCTATLVEEPYFAGIHFTGSTAVFRQIWHQLSSRLDKYVSYPRIVGETGGKDFVVAHQSADPAAVAVGLVRGAYEYQGQKCSAASRAYIPDTIWPEVRDRMVAMMTEIKMGDVADFRNFMGAVIDKKSFDRITGYLEAAKGAPGVKVVAGGGADAKEGWFIQPTLVTTEDPRYRMMCDELFGPVMTVHVYPAAKWRETLELVNGTSPYALTGAVFARDRAALAEASQVLRNAAGNFYLNDKPTGAVVGQQPFGGARASGTNDKAGSILNLVRWVSPRSIKETLVSPTDFRYPYMAAE
jgi:1-pyrroline-5-carboxylate dehydrogenase